MSFLIAYYYWLMIEAHGSVPFFDDLADVNDPNLMRGQMPFDEMVDWIDAQLVDLSKKLPASYLNESTQFYGRATSIMCLAVRARMLLFAASPLVNGNEWYAGFKIMMVNSGSAKLTILQNGNVPLMLTGS